MRNRFARRSTWSIKYGKMNCKVFVRLTLSSTCVLAAFCMTSGWYHSGRRSHPYCEAFRRARPETDISDVRSLKDTFNANLYPSRDGSREFYLCSYPKTGCSQWMHLLHYLLTGEKVSEGLKIHERRHRWSTMLRFPRDVRVLDRDILRILIMRNPYDRVLSAYHDFLKRSPLKNTSFHTFVTMYIAGSGTDVQFEDHRQPISSGCNIWDHDNSSYNIHWDYVLKLEEMWLWSECLFSELRLQKAVAHGWPSKSGRLFGLANVENARVVDYIGPIVGKTRWPSTLEFNVGHERLVSKRWDMFTPELVRIINRIFEVDFQIGGYALWDGVIESLHHSV